MSWFYPSWHPFDAEDYFYLYNNVNKSDGILYYDTTGDLVNIPKTFYFERADSTYDLQIDDVMTNPQSSVAIITNDRINGNFKINSLKRVSSTKPPTIDIYVSGKIRKGTISKKVEKDNEVSSPNSVNFDASYNINPTRFSDGEKIGIKWSRDSATFSPEGFTDSGNNYYTYIDEGDSITFTNNWNNETVTGSNRNQDNYKYFTSGIDLDNLSEIPKISCTWTILWGYECTSYCDCDGNDAEECDTDTCEGDEGHQEWTGVLTQGLHIRNAYCAQIDKTKDIYPQAGTEVTVYSEEGNYYYCIVPVWEFNQPDGYGYYNYDCIIEKQYVAKK